MRARHHFVSRAHNILARRARLHLAAKPRHWIFEALDFQGSGGPTMALKGKLIEGNGFFGPFSSAVETAALAARVERQTKRSQPSVLVFFFFLFDTLQEALELGEFDP